MPSSAWKLPCWLFSAGITSEPKYVRIAGTLRTGLPSKRVRVSVPGTLYQLFVTAGRFVIASASAGKFAFSAASI